MTEVIEFTSFIQMVGEEFPYNDVDWCSLDDETGLAIGHCVCISDDDLGNPSKVWAMVGDVLAWRVKQGEGYRYGLILSEAGLLHMAPSSSSGSYHDFIHWASREVFPSIHACGGGYQVGDNVIIVGSNHPIPPALKSGAASADRNVSQFLGWLDEFDLQLLDNVTFFQGEHEGYISLEDNPDVLFEKVKGAIEGVIALSAVEFKETC